jgi:xanthine dehydrogenase accessory factor
LGRRPNVNLLCEARWRRPAAWPRLSAVTVVIVRGLGDIGSAVAHLLFREGYGVAVHDEPRPATTRRGMAFADAAFDGEAELDGVRAVRADTVEEVALALARRDAVPVHVGPLGPLLAALGHRVLVDARVRKHAAPEVQLADAELTVAMGPALVAGRHAHVVVETSWDALGAIIAEGASLPLAGEPRAIAGHARDRYVYAPVDGVLRTKARIGDAVRRGEEVARVGAAKLLAPLDGVLRGLTRDDVPVAAGTKVVEVDPRGRLEDVRGIGERPRRIADGVLSAIRAWERRLRP